jgi:GxxExxY protein
VKHEELTHKIIGCAMKVHSVLGNGHQEVIYQRSLAIELREQGLSFVRELTIPIFYGEINVGIRRVDFFVEGVIMVELKAAIRLESIHMAQAMTYIHGYNLPYGLVINFGARSLEFKRIYNLKHPDNKNYRKPRG